MQSLTFNTQPLLSKQSVVMPSKVLSIAPKYNIFFVDDDPLIHKTLDYIYQEKEAFRTFSYYSGEACIANLHKNPQVIILDYHLCEDDTKLSGIETIRKIQEKAPDIPIIVLSSQKAVDVAVSILKQGAIDYVSKDKDIKDNIEKAVQKVVKSIELKKEIEALSEIIKRDKLLIKGYFAIGIFVTMISILLLGMMT